MRVRFWVVVLGSDQALLHRECVERKLDRLFEYRGAEVSGPAGYGKTSAVMAWASATPLADVAWFRLESRHRDSKVLLSELCDVLRSPDGPAVHPDLGDIAGSASRLAGSIEQSNRRVVLVLDETEILDDAPSLEVVRTLVSVQGDALRLVLVGRWIPPVGFDEDRRRGHLVTCSDADLRLSRAETGTIVQQAAQREISDDDLEFVHQLMEGWALGSALSGLVLRDASTPLADLVLDSHGSFDEVVHDLVFDALAPDLQQFLLDTSILYMVEPALCRELTGRTDCEEILRRLTSSNTFTEWVGGPTLAFRYHGVVRSWLRRRFGSQAPERVSQLLERAARWYWANEREPDAIRCLLEAGDVAAATQAIVEYGPRALSEGRYDAVTGWIEQIPQEAVASTGPLLALLAEGGYKAGRAHLGTTARALASELTTEDSAEFDSLRLDILVSKERCRELQFAGRLADAATVALDAITTIDFESLRPDPTSAPTFAEILLSYDVASLAGHLMVAGKTDESVRLSQWVLDAFPAGDRAASPNRISCLGEIALCELLDRRRPAALSHAREALALWDFHGRGAVDVGWALGVLLVIDPMIDRSEAHRQIDRFRRAAVPPAVAGLAGLLRAWSYVRSSEIEAAGAMVSKVEPIIDSMTQPGMMQSLLRRVEAMVAAGVDEPVLAERERDVLAALATGLSRRDAAEQMHLSVNTIKTYAQHAYRALGVSTLPEAIERCHELGIPLETPHRSPG